ncbi:MAG TPA: alpha/beta fold hydrolase [Candidatus Baltobacteraceae bacterium]|jgi:hypothetical protein
MKRSAFLSGTIVSLIPSGVCMAAPTDENYDLQTPTGTIYGSLTMPAPSEVKKVVLIIAGSGPTDRNCNSPAGIHTDAYLLLAKGLAERGIASVRFDKRGIAASAAAASSESDLRFETYISDAQAWVRRLRSDGRFKHVTIAGHSEGSLIGMIAARNESADGYASLEGPAFPAAAILRTQLAEQLSAYPDLKAANDRILKALSAGQTTPDVPSQLLALYRPSIQPYLISWFRYDPRTEIAKLSCPVTIIQGTADLQVSVDNGKALRDALPRARLVMIAGMSHVLKDTSSDSLSVQQTTVYTDPRLPIDSTLVRTLSEP